MKRFGSLNFCICAILNNFEYNSEIGAFFFGLKATNKWNIIQNLFEFDGNNIDCKDSKTFADKK